MASSSAHRRGRRRTVLGLALAALAALAALPAAAQAAAPHNDAFADAQIVRVGDRLAGSIAEATTQAGEPATSSSLIENTVWYRLTTTATENLRIDTCDGNNPYSEVAIFTGATVSGLTAVALGPYGCNGGGRATFTADAGTTYHVRVAGYDWGGDVALSVARPQPPPNDLFAQAQPVGLPAHIRDTTVDATVEPGEPEPSEFGSGHSVWYRVTATTRDSIRISTCADHVSNTIVSVYTGASVSALTNAGIARSFIDVCGLSTAIVLSPVVGTTYFISVRGNGSSADTFTLDIEAPSPPGPPPPVLPKPACPFDLAAPGSVSYRGTHSAGGAVCITLRPDFKGVTWFTLSDPPRGLCDIPIAVERLDPAAPIANRTFALKTAWARVSGSFAYGRGAKGTFQAVRTTANSTCLSRELTWSAVTTASPPWLHPDTTPPMLTLSGARVQRPLSSRRVVVGVRCPQEACAASATMKIEAFTIKATRTALARNRARMLRLVLPANARRAVRSALRSRRSIRARVVVIARDADGNARRATRTITLRR
jgi:hypothetical protein